MKRIPIYLFIIVLLLSACAPTAPQAIVPVETLVAQTVAALPKIATPSPFPSATFTNTPIPPPEISPTPGLPLGVPGADCVPTNTERTQARVARVVDGDTIEVVYGNVTHTVRYIGMDAPEPNPSNMLVAGAALQLNKALVGGQVVLLVKDTSDMDSAGRLLRYVFVGSAFVNYALLRQGGGVALVEAPDTACETVFAAAENEAKAAVIGVWAPTPLPTNTATRTPTATPNVTATPTLVPACNCTGPVLSCNSFRDQPSAQACFNYCKATGFGDIFGLDNNNNGIACEGFLK